ncbi:hypothetical protein AURDEDRAFT_156050 [Auricularia subglabra TFB-10046 SS5]|nr:hypothetical protein AURDEDRAFT_156050 [Auricularia subglabra TFB-10046 SS5]
MHGALTISTNLFNSRVLSLMFSKTRLATIVAKGVRLFSNITWKVPNAYARDSARKKAIEQKVISHVEANGLETERGAASAEIRGTEHSGGTNPREGNHVTVVFKDGAGNHITTHHVPV